MQKFSRNNLSQKIDLQIKLFRSVGVPEFEALTEKYLKLRDDWPNGRFTHAFDNARKGVYLGLPKTFFHTEESISRALFNMEFGLQKANGKAIEKGDILLICEPKPQKEKMPEALWKYSILFDGREIGRLGVNFHREDESIIIASFVNVQGKDGGPHEEYKSVHGRRDFWSKEAIRAVIDSLRQSVDHMRGISSVSGTDQRRV